MNNLNSEPKYLTVDEGARLLRFDATAVDPVAAFRKWLRRHAVPVLRRGRDGRTLLIERRVLVRIHDLRHTHATLLLQAGAPIIYVIAQLGHPLCH